MLVAVCAYADYEWQLKYLCKCFFFQFNFWKLCVDFKNETSCTRTHIHKKILNCQNKLKLCNKCFLNINLFSQAGNPLLLLLRYYIRYFNSAIDNDGKRQVVFRLENVSHIFNPRNLLFYRKFSPLNTVACLLAGLLLEVCT